MRDRLQQSASIQLYYDGEASVVARPAEAGHQRVPEVSIKDRGVDVLGMSPDAARDLAVALRNAADAAEQ